MVENKSIEKKGKKSKTKAIINNKDKNKAKSNNKNINIKEENKEINIQIDNNSNNNIAINNNLSFSSNNEKGGFNQVLFDYKSYNGKKGPVKRKKDDRNKKSNRTNE